MIHMQKTPFHDLEPCAYVQTHGNVQMWVVHTPCAETCACNAFRKASTCMITGGRGRRDHGVELLALKGKTNPEKITVRARR